MSLNLVDLNTPNVRAMMLQEFSADVAARTVYMSTNLNPSAGPAYIALMQQAIQNGNTASLAQGILNRGLLKQSYQRMKKGGGTTTVTMPKDAHTKLAEGEFNRYYLRGLCLEALAQRKMVLVYRAKAVRQPRASSQAIIGTQLNPQQLLANLRNNVRVLGGPNSGISCRIV